MTAISWSAATHNSHTFFFCRSSLLSASITSFLSFHTVICWPLVIRRQTGGLVWLPTASLQTWLCVCALDIGSQTGLRFQGWCFSLCGTRAANVSVCVCLTSRLPRYFTGLPEKKLGDIQRNQTLFCLYPLWPNPGEPELSESLWIQVAHGTIKSIHDVVC